MLNPSTVPTLFTSVSGPLVEDMLAERGDVPNYLRGLSLVANYVLTLPRAENFALFVNPDDSLFFTGLNLTQDAVDFDISASLGQGRRSMDFDHRVRKGRAKTVARADMEAAAIWRTLTNGLADIVGNEVLPIPRVCEVNLELTPTEPVDRKLYQLRTSLFVGTSNLISSTQVLKRNA